MHKPVGTAQRGLPEAVGHAWGDWGGKGGVRKKEPRKEGPQRLAKAHGLLGAGEKGI